MKWKATIRIVEPHYQIINRPDQAQIYEMVMGDVNGQFTTVLMRGYAPLKDNRLPPIGFPPRTAPTTPPAYSACFERSRLQQTETA
jgi:hypothetical protein